MVDRADRLTAPDSSGAQGPDPDHGSDPGQALVPGLVPESELERRLARDPVLLEGWAWGTPRQGHPEGSVGVHVGDLLRTIEEWGEVGDRRSELRLLALVHDSLKFQVRNRLPKAGRNDHAVRARLFAEDYTDDERLLSTIEQHDRPYQIWRRLRRAGRPDERAFARMLESVQDLSLFLRFVELDGSTAGKNPEPVDWFRGELRRRRPV